METSSFGRSLPAGFERPERGQRQLLLDQELPRSTLYRRRGKRLLDLIIGGPLLLLALPLIGLLALAVGFSSGWPAFYGARRLGKDGRPFRMWKLRTMVHNADALLERWCEKDPETAQLYFRGYKLHGDPRVTRIGRWLRRTSLDELPQLWNVVRGEMSLVGPRPIVQDELDEYGDAAPVFLSASPGMTGSWQINGRNGIDYPERATLELAYVLDQSCLGDLRLLARTLPALLRLEGL